MLGISIQIDEPMEEDIPNAERWHRVDVVVVDVLIIFVFRIKPINICSKHFLHWLIYTYFRAAFTEVLTLTTKNEIITETERLGVPEAVQTMEGMLPFQMEF